MPGVWNEFQCVQKPYFTSKHPRWGETIWIPGVWKELVRVHILLDIKGDAANDSDSGEILCPLSLLKSGSYTFHGQGCLSAAHAKGAWQHCCLWLPIRK